VANAANNVQSIAWYISLLFAVWAYFPFSSLSLSFPVFSLRKKKKKGSDSSKGYTVAVLGLGLWLVGNLIGVIAHFYIPLHELTRNGSFG
jgi:accessory gene regulator protein AgrB